MVNLSHTNQIDGYEENGGTGNQLFDSTCINRCVPGLLWNKEEKDGKKHKRKKRKKKKKKKDRSIVGIEEIVFMEDDCETQVTVGEQLNEQLSPSQYSV